MQVAAAGAEAIAIPQAEIGIEALGRRRDVIPQGVCPPEQLVGHAVRGHQLTSEPPVQRHAVEIPAAVVGGLRKNRDPRS